MSALFVVTISITDKNVVSLNVDIFFTLIALKDGFLMPAHAQLADDIWLLTPEQFQHNIFIYYLYYHTYLIP